jgi:hypothetical protein
VLLLQKGWVSSRGVVVVGATVGGSIPAGCGAAAAVLHVPRGAVVARRLVLLLLLLLLLLLRL